MPGFSWSGRDAGGKPVNGVMDAASAQAVAGQLSQRGVTPLKISAAAGPAAGSDRQAGKAGEIDFSALFYPKKVPLEELIIFSRQMASLTRAGIPINRCFAGLGASVRHLLLADTLKQIARDLESGLDLATCLQRHPKVFSRLFVNLVHVGENTGRLDEAFVQINSYLELERETKKRMKSATRYPTFVLSAIAVAMGVINLFVIPAFAKVFESFNAELPWQTRVLIAISEFTLAWWPALLALAIASYFGLRYWVATAEGRLTWDRWKLKLPLVGGIFERIHLGRFARAFAMMMRAGVPVLTALRVVAGAVGNEYTGSRILSIVEHIERGESLSRAAASAGMFTPLILQMLTVGEETGQVDELLDEVADFYEEEVDYDLKRLGDAIEPILVIAIGAMVLVLALGVFLPLWELASIARR